MIPRTCRTCDQRVYGPPFKTVDVIPPRRPYPVSASLGGGPPSCPEMCEPYTLGRRLVLRKLRSHNGSREREVKGSAKAVLRRHRCFGLYLATVGDPSGSSLKSLLRFRPESCVEGDRLHSIAAGNADVDIASLIERNRLRVVIERPGDPDGADYGTAGGVDDKRHHRLSYIESFTVDVPGDALPVEYAETQVFAEGKASQTRRLPAQSLQSAAIAPPSAVRLTSNRNESNRRLTPHTCGGLATVTA
jgi:hypothetical protein